MGYLLGTYLIGIIISGLIVWLITVIFLAHTDSKIKNRTQIVSFLILLAVYRSFVLPLIDDSHQRQKIEEGLLSVAAFAALKKTEPQVFDYLVKNLLVTSKKTNNQDILLATAQQKISPIYINRLITSSDEILISYIEEILVVIEALGQQSAQMCIQYLFNPQQVKSNQLPLSEVQRAKMLALMERVFNDPNDKTIPPKELIAPIIGKLLENLSDSYSAHELSALDDPLNAKYDDKVTCTLVQDLYQDIIQLPPQQAGATLRYLLSQKNKK